ncbi:MAG: Plug domain-containing protein, partial [Pseudomonadota bacterium]
MKLRLIAPIALVAGGAAAQSADEPLVLSDVVVAAPGPSRTADELIGNATVLKRDEILANLSTTLGDTLDREPGVSSTYFGPGASRPVLRGLG